MLGKSREAAQPWRVLAPSSVRAARAAPETRRLISNRHFFLIVPVAGKAKTKGPAVSVSGEGRFLAVLWLCHAAEGGREHSGLSVIRALH